MAHLDKFKFLKYAHPHTMGENHQNSLAKHCKVNKIKNYTCMKVTDFFSVLQERLSYRVSEPASWLWHMVTYTGPKDIQIFKEGTQSPLRFILHLLVLPSPSSKGQLITLNTFELPHIYTTTQNPQYTPLKFKPGVWFHCWGYAPNNSLRASVGINQTNTRCLMAKSLVIGAK